MAKHTKERKKDYDNIVKNIDLIVYWDSQNEKGFKNDFLKGYGKTIIQEVRDNYPFLNGLSYKVKVIDVSKPIKINNKESYKIENVKDYLKIKDEIIYSSNLMELVIELSKNNSYKNISIFFKEEDLYNRNLSHLIYGALEKIIENSSN